MLSLVQLCSCAGSTEMPPPTCLCGKDRLTERNETELDLSELQIIFHFLLILRTILPCPGHKAAEKQHLDISLALRAAVIKRVKAIIFQSVSLSFSCTHIMHHTLICVSSEALLFILKHFPYIADSQKHLKCQKHSPPTLAKKGRIF